MNFKFTAYLLLSALMLASCGGGGGGGGGNSNSATAFTKFSAIQPGSTIKITGISQGAPYTLDSFDKIATFGETSTPSEGTSFTLKLNNSLLLTSAKAQAPLLTKTYSPFYEADFVSGGFPFLLMGFDNDSNPTSLIIFNNPLYDADPSLPLLQDYQSYAVWGDSSQSGTFGATSLGAITNPGEIPTTVVTGPTSPPGRYSYGYEYTGLSVGTFGETGGDGAPVGGSIIIGADFDNRKLTFKLSSVDVLNLNGLTSGLVAPSLDFTQEISYNSNSNIFSGKITTFPGMTGTITGRFYGPNAKEIGGIFELTNTEGAQKYIGSFGGSGSSFAFDNCSIPPEDLSDLPDPLDCP